MSEKCCFAGGRGQLSAFSSVFGIKLSLFSEILKGVFAFRQVSSKPVVVRCAVHDVAMAEPQGGVRFGPWRFGRTRAGAMAVVRSQALRTRSACVAERNCSSWVSTTLAYLLKREAPNF